MPALPHLYRNQAADLLEQAAKDILATGDSITIQNTINNTFNALRDEAKKRPDGPKKKKPTPAPAPEQDEEDSEAFSSLDD